MSHTLVKIVTDDDGTKNENPTWHLVTHWGDSQRTLCSGEVFGEGEGRAIFKVKTVDNGIPCERCALMVRWYKAIKL